MKLFVLIAALFGAALAHPDYPELYDKVYMHIQHNKKDPNEVYAKIRLRWDEYPGATEYQVCRNCHIDAYGHETDKSMGSLYSFKQSDSRDIDPYFICDDKRDRHHCVGHIFQAGLKVSYFSVRAKTGYEWTRWSPAKRYEIDPAKTDDPEEVVVERREL